jgi:hypothetical protein
MLMRWVAFGTSGGVKVGVLLGGQQSAPVHLEYFPQVADRGF